jgi:glycosyltransferase involved in cell wall biosynthesis
VRFTLITPTLNPGPGLEFTLQSVLTQDHTDREYWVIDGRSTDGTQDLLRCYDDTLNWISEPDRGQGEAVNKGFQRATGEVIGWIGADDAYAPGALKRVSLAFETHPDVDFVYGDGIVVDERDRVIKHHRSNPKVGCRQLIRRGIGGLCGPTVFFKRRLLQRVGGCDNTLRHGIDYDLWCRMLDVASPLYLPETLAVCRALPRRRDRSRRETALREYREIRDRYLRGRLDASWSRFYDLRTKAYLLTEPFLVKSFPKVFQSIWF